MKNILIILSDQQRKDSLGCYGNQHCPTPNLDKLAARGRRFERHYVGNPICMPSRMTIFTGQYPRNHGLWTNGLLIDERPTLPGHLGELGYETASIGKIHFTPTGGDAGNFECPPYWSDIERADRETGPYWGFQHVELSVGHTKDIAHYGRWFYNNGGTADMLKTDALGNRPIPEELHDSAWVAERTMAYLDGVKQAGDSDKPFFLVASFPDPHHPFDPPQSAYERFDPQSVHMPVGAGDDLQTRPAHYREHFKGAWHRSGPVKASHSDGVDEATTRRNIAQTYAMVDLIDRNVGRILDHLEETGIAENTIVVFLSDHGELLGDHGLWYKGPFFYECLINTPLIIAGPSVEVGVSDTLFSDVDLGATLCDLAVVPAPAFHDGISQAEHLRNAESPGPRTRCLIEYRNGFDDADMASHALVTERYKYVGYENGDEELTDLQRDPEERRNVAGDVEYAETLHAMRRETLLALLEAKRRGPEQLCHA